MRQRLRTFLPTAEDIRDPPVRALRHPFLIEDLHDRVRRPFQVSQDAQLREVRGEDPGGLEQVDPRPVGVQSRLDRAQPHPVVAGVFRKQR